MYTTYCLLSYSGLFYILHSLSFLSSISVQSIFVLNIATLIPHSHETVLIISSSC